MMQTQTTSAFSRFHFNYDGATVLTLWLVATFAIPQGFVFPGGGAIARPAVLVGVIGAFAYALSRLSPAMVPHGRNPVALGLYAYFTVIVMSVALSYNRDLFPHEINGGYRQVIYNGSMLGVALVAASMQDRSRLELVLKRMVVCGGGLALIALLQFYAGFDLLEYVRYPGLVIHGDELLQSGVRSGFTRSTSTAAHAIELSVVMAMLLPFALHYALHEPNRVVARWYWLSAGLMAATLPTTVSRSAVVAVGISLGSLVMVWSGRQLVRAVVSGAVLTAIIYASRPTLLGSILALFRNAGTDDSIAGRTDDYDFAFAFVAERPIFGRGAGTWGAYTNLLLDNQFLLSLLEIGWLGVLVMSGMYALALISAREIRFRAPDDPTRHLGQVLFGSLLAGVVTLFFVDGFYYAMHTGLLFLFIGTIGGLFRLMRAQSAPDDVIEIAAQRQLLSPRLTVDAGPRWWVLAMTAARRGDGGR